MLGSRPVLGWIAAEMRSQMVRRWLGASIRGASVTQCPEPAAPHAASPGHAAQSGAAGLQWGGGSGPCLRLGLGGAAAAGTQGEPAAAGAAHGPARGRPSPSPVPCGARPVHRRPTAAAAWEEGLVPRTALAPCGPPGPRARAQCTPAPPPARCGARRHAEPAPVHPRCLRPPPPRARPRPGLHRCGAAREGRPLNAPRPAPSPLPPPLCALPPLGCRPSARPVQPRRRPAARWSAPRCSSRVTSCAS